MQNRLRLARESRGWSQVELARSAGVSRQLIGAVEAGRHAPRVDAALALARALGVAVEDLFAPAVTDAPDVVWLSGREPALATAPGLPVLAARVGDRLVVTPSAGAQQWMADAQAAATDAEVSWMPGADPDAALIAGCDPALGIIAAILARRSGRNLVIAHASSTRSAEWLDAGLVHAAVVHGRPDELPTMSRPVDRFVLTGWRVGLAGRPNGRVPTIEQVCEEQIPVVQRETGAGTQTAFLSAVRRAGAAAPPPGPVAASHLDVTSRVLHGAPVGVTMEPAAISAGLPFHPLVEHTVELWIDPEHRAHLAVAALADLMHDTVLRRRLAAIPGYDTASTGARLAEPVAS
ncbi:MAG: helix-turn-helix domain-containing protein [Actinobacteria bacterium]|nr:helix-turn-helix domain-containing protein [Actinomycetota bacterium]